jgi:peptidoglycan/LPS O-acetylase OafA/YrhL
MHSGWNDALLVVPFALLIFSTQTDKGAASVPLCSAIPVTIGLMSYSIYMWHIPLRIMLVFAGPKFGMFVIQELLLASFMTIAISWLSFRYFETPVRRRLTSTNRALAIDPSRPRLSSWLE